MSNEEKEKIKIKKSLLYLSILTNKKTLGEALIELNSGKFRKYAGILDTTVENVVWLTENFFEIFKKEELEKVYRDYYNEYKNNEKNMTTRFDFFKRYLDTSQDEVKLFGEVFTPDELINEMLDKLPVHIWKDPDLKWLDPANGIGNFPIFVFKRLMVGLKTRIQNEEKRRKHILEEMLYMVDISVKNTFICMNIFDLENKYKLNIHRGDFLNMNIEEIFGIREFNIIMGNKPYQSSGSGGGKLGGNQKKLYQYFVRDCLKLLKEDGYLLFIHPPNWRCGMKQISKSFGNDLKNGQMIYLNQETAQKYFRNSSRIDWYLFQNKPSYKDTIIENYSGKFKLRLNKYKIIPNDFNDHVKGIFEKTLYADHERIKMSGSDERIKAPSPVKTKEFPYPYMVPGKNEKNRDYSSKKHPLQDKLKVIMSSTADAGGLHLSKDYGTAGVFGTHIVICKTKQEVDNIFMYFNSKLFRLIIKLTNFNRFYNYAINPLIPLPKIRKKVWKESDIYKYFGLSQEEINYLNNYSI